MRTLLVICLSALCACGGSDPASPEPAPAPAPVPAPAPAPAPAPPPEADLPDFTALSDADAMAWLMERGEAVYKTGGTSGIACLTCHMENGEGVPGAFPPLAGSGGFYGDCAQHAGYILDGLTGEIEVKGTKYNGAMPAQANLSDAEIAAVITYERNSWGNDDGICKPSDVAKRRGGE